MKFFTFTEFKNKLIILAFYDEIHMQRNPNIFIIGYRRRRRNVQRKFEKKRR